MGTAKSLDKFIVQQNTSRWVIDTLKIQLSICWTGRNIKILPSHSFSQELGSK